MDCVQVGGNPLPPFSPGWATISSYLVSSFGLAVYTNETTVVLGDIHTAYIGNAPWTVGTDAVNLL